MLVSDVPGVLRDVHDPSSRIGRLTIAEGRTVFWSRSRQELWRKGETSGHVQHVEEIRVDCDADVLLIRAHQVGAACHTGERSCFFRTLGD